MNATTCLMTSTLAVAALVAGGCRYDLAPERATAARWDTEDGDDRRITEREVPSTTAQVTPEELPRGGGRYPFVEADAAIEGDEGVPLAEVTDADLEAPAVVTTVPVTVVTRPTGERELDDTRPAAAEEPQPSPRLEAQPTTPADDEGVPVEVAAPDPLPEEDLRALAAEEPPEAPLIADGFIRDESCPMDLRGTRVSLLQREGGPALVFKTTRPAAVEELQNRVMALALTKDEELVEEGAFEAGIRPSPDEDLDPEVRPPEEMDEGPRSGMPFNLPTELTRAEREAAEEPDVALRLPPLPRADVTVELTDDGAEVLFVPVLDGQRDALTRQLAARAEALEEGECPAQTMSMVSAPPRR